MTLPARSTAIKATIGDLLTAAVGVFLQYLALPEDFPTSPRGRSSWPPPQPVSRSGPVGPGHASSASASP